MVSITAFTEELRRAVRTLWRSRAFSVPAVLTLGIGIAGVTVMSALVNAVLLQPLPVRDQDRLIVAWWTSNTGGHAHVPFGAAAVDEIERHTRLLESVAAYAYNGAIQFAAIEDGSASYVRAGVVDGDFFRVVGTAAMIGRTLEPSDNENGAEPVLVIDEGLWRRRYGGRADAIGRRVRLQTQSFRIVGVVPAVDLPRGAEAWISMQGFLSNAPSPQARVSIERDHDLVSRLRPGVTIPQAQAELSALTAEYRRRIGSELVPVIRSYEEEVVGDLQTPVLLLFGAVGLVLLIACANLANLLLQRGEERSAEIAVRRALGAARRQLTRQVLAETLALGAISAVAALVSSWWSLEGLVALAPTELPRIMTEVRIDARVVGFTLLITFAAVASTGLVSALISTRVDPLVHLRGARVASATSRRGRRTLVVAQIAFAVTVLAAAGVLTQTLLQLRSADMGLATDRLAFVDLFLPRPEYEEVGRRRQFLQELARDVQAIPGVGAVTPIAVRPYAGLSGWDTPRFAVEGQSADEAARNPSLDLQSIYPEHFDTLGINVMEGRGITVADTEKTPPVAVVSENVARQVWPGDSPIGKRLKMGGVDSKAGWFTVIGVAGTTRYRELAQPRATLYVAAAQFVDGAGSLAIRTSAPLETIAGAVRDRVRNADPDVFVLQLEPFTTFLARPLARPRFVAWLSNIFGATALLLAAIGLYAVMAAFVRQRTREIGVRVALGATNADVRWLILGEALWLAGAGTALGLAGAVVTSGLLRGLLFGVQPLDPATLAAAMAVLVATIAVACYVPVRRATRVDPLLLLKAE